MTLIDAAISRSRMVVSVLIFVLVAGAYAYVSIPKEADPDINIPILYVTLSFEGISPEDSERLLVRPLEKELSSVEGAVEMRSSAYEGGGNVLLEFEAGFDVDTALADVREAVDNVAPDLPDGTDDPTVYEVNLSLFPVLVVTLSGPAPERTLLKYARILQDRIEEIPNVLEATMSGDRDEIVELIVNPAQLESYQLEPTQLINKLRADNQLVAAGALDSGAGRFTIKVPGIFESVVDILNMPLFSNGEGIVRIRDIAEVRRSFKDPDSFARLNGEAALGIDVSKRVGVNIIETIEQVRAVVAKESKNWPDAIDITFSQDKSSDIRNMLTDLQNNVIAAILLVMIVVIAALGVRGGILVGMAIPGSFLTGILILFTAGLTVNIVVLFSLILAVGMLVDGAIVVSEFADRKLSEGLDKTEAYALAAKRMSLPIIASTLTTLAAFLPLMFWPGVVGEFMKFLPITLIATLSASLAMALIFLPTLGTALNSLGILLSGILLTACGAGLFFFGSQALIPVSADQAGPLVGILPPLSLLLGGLFGLGVFIAIRRFNEGRMPPLLVNKELSKLSASHIQSEADLMKISGFTGLYVRVLGVALRVPIVILILALMVLVGSWMTYGKYGRGVEFFPKVEPEQLLVNIYARGNLSILEQDQLVRRVEEQVLAIQAEQAVFKSVYAQSGILRSRNEDAEDIIGKLQLELEDWDKRPPAEELKTEMRRRTAQISGIVVEVRQPEAGPPVGKAVKIQLSSVNPALMDPLIAQIRTRMDNMPNLTNIEDSRPIPGIEWRLAVDRAQATKFDVDISTLGGFVQMVTRGFKLDSYRPNDADEEIDILLRMPKEYRTIDQLDRLRVTGGSGSIPVGNFLTREPTPKTGTLQRIDGQRIMFVAADMMPGALANDAVNELAAFMETLEIPEAVQVSFKGEDEEQKKSQSFLMKAFSIALFLIAVILITQFNSFYSALLILTAVIMSTIGVMIGLLVINQPFSIVMSGIGVIALAGIVVNNNIVLIDTFDQLRKTAENGRTAILLTGAQRLRPVLLTTTTTILGLIPMVMKLNIDFATREISQGAPSTQWWQQLSTAIVFGLGFATILTLIVTPSLLMLREQVSGFLARGRAARQKKREDRQKKREDEKLADQTPDTLEEDTAPAT